MKWIDPDPEKTAHDDGGYLTVSTKFTEISFSPAIIEESTVNTIRGFLEFRRFSFLSRNGRTTKAVT
jgi:hypothetical protein